MVISTLEEFFLKGKKKGKIEGKKKGKIEGKIEGKVQDILKILNKRFRKIPKSVSQSLNSYTDLIALDSLFELALDCKTLAEFERELVY
ncbi:MAG: DUF4351 domain-containing protein [Planctomycetaceae bacterium]|jgi:predicted transposase YdaD|nr:DUF4351 domain-containing protein [Planctomycetaceae bacterium]